MVVAQFSGFGAYDWSPLVPLDGPSFVLGKAAADWDAILALLRQYSSGGIPIYFLLGWIKRESGGDNADTTPSREYGYLQISPQESKTFGFDHDRLHVDPDYAIQSGVILVNSYADDAVDLGYARGSDDAWKIVKLIHTVGHGGTGQIINAAGGGTPSWSQIEASVDPGMSVGGRTAASAFGIVDDSFTMGADLADQLGVDLSEGTGIGAAGSRILKAMLITVLIGGLGYGAYYLATRRPTRGRRYARA